MTTDQKKDDPTQQKTYELSEFLESVPPQMTCLVSGFKYSSPHLASPWKLAAQDIRLFCSEDACNGYRYFSTDVGEFEVEKGRSRFFHTIYRCRNCRQGLKIFSLWFTLSKDGAAATVMKFGEWPDFGPQTPSRVITLIGPDRELFLKGRRSENQGLGIGAFGYYRRVVENQNARIFESIIKVSEKLGADNALLQDLKAAKEETQFGKAVESVKHGFPQSLLINGHNPLTLLHTALSKGLHSESDQECLSLATGIRVVLSELAERIGQALKDEAELTQAVSRLLEVKAKKSG